MSRPATPGTWPGTVDEHIAPRLSTSALLIIDAQVDFVDGGVSPVEGTTAIVPALVTLWSAFRQADLPIIHVVRMYQGVDVDRVRRTAVAGGAQLVAVGSSGAQVVPELRPEGSAEPAADRLLAGELVEVGPGEVVLWKPRWSAFYRTRLDEHLASLAVDTVVVAGCNFPNCPRATIYDSSEYDYRVLVASDAVSGVTPMHLDELGAIGVLHAGTRTIVAAMKMLPAISP
ncbi:MAG: cysteine hydrolase [Actinomycetota bacterium]|nr:cysteine hydrolase [Actinomycetota bacterium]